MKLPLGIEPDLRWDMALPNSSQPVAMELDDLQESHVHHTSRTSESRSEHSPSDHEKNLSLVSNPEQDTSPKSSSRWRTLWPLCVSLTLITSFAVFVHWYIYNALVSDHSRLKKLHLSQSRTLLSINLLATALSLLLSMLLRQAFDTLRWHMLAQQDSIASLSFVALSSGTSLYCLSVLILTYGAHLLWTLQK